ncbi:MAG: ParB/RepB/Spo0J family partition protein [Bacilli bacterium]|nr:ParB/RepB/Spo0J family partition protein [Bacilli bacterium]MDD4053317.1 ParB/RepB/Spo0J family partition protein [Bacilli bacterium]MDD4411342.1 ParB/RepB/Spo0J family partition protein [Bacilli bacterium]
MNNNMEKEIFDIYLYDIIPNRFQPRLQFDEKSLNELADSIKQHGIIQPLVVRKLGDKYEIIAGERRFKAAQIAGLQKVPAVIMNLDDKQSAEVAVIENIQRKDLTALEEAESYKKLLDKGYLTQEQLANRMGKTQSTVSNKLRLLGLDEEVKMALLNEKISERHARSLLTLKTPEEQKQMLNNIINNKLTVKQTDEIIKAGTNEKIETLDFSSVPSSLPPTPESDNSFASEEPVVEEPIKEVPMSSKETVPMPTIPFVDSTHETIIDPISKIDINQIKEMATDINQEDQPADVNALLGIKPAAVVIQPVAPVSDVQQRRFITSLEDEEANMNMSEPNTNVSSNVQPNLSPFVQETQSEAMPQTYTDSLVQEFRQSNNPQQDSKKIVEGDLRSAINSVREATQLLEQNKFKVDVEEFDFENIYQIIIKINK